MYDVTREELVAAVEAEEREWLSTDDGDDFQLQGRDRNCHF